MRKDKRNPDQLRNVKITSDYLDYPEGSCLIEMGKTKVICAVSYEEQVPPFLEGKGTGWITSEYSMLPRSTHTRSRRESSAGKVSGRTQEIQRLIGRCLRSVVSLNKMGPYTLYVDCDVIQADGGTRTASITGSYVALCLAVKNLINKGKIESSPIQGQLAAISVGIVKGETLLDLDYSEDSKADIDLNLIMNSEQRFIEIQGTSEKSPATKEQLDSMIEFGWQGIKKLFVIQNLSLK